LLQDQADILAESQVMADFYDRVLTLGADASKAAVYLINDTTGYLKDTKKEFADLAITPENLRDLIAAVTNGTITSNVVKQLLPELLASSGDVNQMIKDKGLGQISDESGLRTIVQEVLDSSPTQLEDYKKKPDKVRQYFLGAVMKATKGKANPQMINKLLDEMLPTVPIE
jgi:aspartyl-tRNA(Asn)/glutamyl-tRNA(Gln) amidotransferase subunit B